MFSNGNSVNVLRTHAHHHTHSLTRDSFSALCCLSAVVSLFASFQTKFNYGTESERKNVCECVDFCCEFFSLCRIKIWYSYDNMRSREQGGRQGTYTHAQKKREKFSFQTCRAITTIRRESDRIPSVHTLAALSQPHSRCYNHTILTHSIQNSPFILRWTTELCYILRWYLYVNYRFAAMFWHICTCMYARAIRRLLLPVLLLRSHLCM